MLYGLFFTSDVSILQNKHFQKRAFAGAKKWFNFLEFKNYLEFGKIGFDTACYDKEYHALTNCENRILLRFLLFEIFFIFEYAANFKCFKKTGQTAEMFGWR